MEIKSINVYTVNELTPEAQKKAHDKWIEGNDYVFLSDCMNERLHELLGENKIKDLNDTSKPGTKPTQVQYCLSNCQGDGAMFAGDFEWNGYSVHIKHSGRYTHSNSKTIEIVKDENDLSMDADDNIYKEFEVIYQAICKELEQYGYNWIKQEDSLESFIEACEANEYTFRINGVMENI